MTYHGARKLGSLAVAGLLGVTTPGYSDKNAVKPPRNLHSEASSLPPELAGEIDKALEEPVWKRNRLLRRLSRNVDPSAYPQILERIKGAGNFYGLSTLQAELWSEWGAIDPKGALDYASRMGESCSQFIGMIVRVWAETDEKAASFWVDALPKGEVRRQASQGLLTSIGERDPTRFALLLQENAKAGKDIGDYYSIWHWWTENDPRAAAEAVLLFPKGKERNRAVRVVAAKWGLVDLKGAMAWVSKLPQEEGRTEVMRELVGTLSSKDPQEALKIAVAEFSGEDRRQAISKAVAVLTRMNHAAALAWLDQVPTSQNEDRRRAIGAIAGQWAKTDPVGALNWLMKFPANEPRAEEMRSIVRDWAENDPQKAAMWVEKLPVHQQKDLISTVAWRWSHVDRKAALEWVENLPMSLQRQRGLSQIVMAWARKDPEAALKYAMPLPLSSFRNRLISEALETWLEKDVRAGTHWLQQNVKIVPASVWESLVRSITRQNPERAIALVRYLPESRSEVGYQLGEQIARYSFDVNAASLLDKIPDDTVRLNSRSGYISGLVYNDPIAAGAGVMRLPEGMQRMRAMQSLVQSWGSMDPMGAVQWALSLSEKGGRDKVVGDVVRQWAAIDVDEAMEYVSQLEAGSTRDQALEQIVTVITYEDPQIAVVWAAAIGDVAKRQNSLDNVIRTWKRNDPAAANAWIGASSQPPEWKEKMINAK